MKRFPPEQIFIPSPAQVIQICQWGKIRQDASTHLENHKVNSQSDLFDHTLGVKAEYFTAQYLGIEYQFTVNTFKEADLPGNIEVRCTTVSYYKLKVCPNDPGSRKVVLAISSSIAGELFLAGWTYGIVGKSFKLKDPRNAGRPIHLVPQRYLMPMSLLRELICQELNVVTK